MANSSESAKQIGRNITNLLIEKEKTQQELADAIGVSKSTVSTWTNGKRIPRMDKVDLMCDYFGVNRSDILSSHGFHVHPLPMPKSAEEDFKRKVLEIMEEQQRQQQEYYEDETVQIVTDKLRTNPEYSVLFKAASNVKPEDIELVKRFIEKFSD